jgi:hypothetical protein
MARGHEKRATPRIQPYVAPCRLILDPRAVSAFLVELSVKGARVSCDEDPPPVGTRLVLEVRLGSRVARSRLRSEVKWVEGKPEGRSDFGLTFVDVSPEDQKVLAAIVEEFKRRASQLA